MYSKPPIPPSLCTPPQRLNLADTGITDAGMAHLAPLTRLRDLNLFFCQITDAGIAPLMGLTALVRLNLDTRCACVRGGEFLVCVLFFDCPGER